MSAARPVKSAASTKRVSFGSTKLVIPHSVTFANQSDQDLIPSVKEILTNIDGDSDIRFLVKRNSFFFTRIRQSLSFFNIVFDDKNNETHTIHIFVRNLISTFLSLYSRRRYSFIKII